MHAGSESLRVAIVPGSGFGFGELAGIEGEREIHRDGGTHRHSLRYRLR